jgi:hypothetical protein
LRCAVPPGATPTTGRRQNVSEPPSAVAR